LFIKNQFNYKGRTYKKNKYTNMATLKPSYANKASITISLNNLANNAVATSNAIDNSSNLYQDALVEVIIKGTAAANAFCDVRLLCSEDNSAWGTWESAIRLGTIDLSVSPNTGHFSLVNMLYQMPKYWKLAVKNVTGNALAAADNSASYQGINVISA